MTLLELSMAKDGVTMPIVAARNDKGEYVIIDGFHRTQVIKYFPAVHKSLCGYVPVVELNKDIADRIAATVRHNMARGTHQTSLSAQLVSLLKKHYWPDEKIGKELGMEPDEVLRLKQLSGLVDIFSDKEFSKAWE
jgi:ParB-like chromosome segregation protein Spo0J